MTAEEQSRMQRIAQVVEAYASQGLAVSVEETDNWAMMSTQIAAMKRRGTRPQHYTYKIKLLAGGEEMSYPLVAGPLTLTQVANSINPPGTALYTGTITGGTANAFAGLVAQIYGFPEVANGANNSGPGGYLITNSSATTITCTNPNAVAASNQTATLVVLSVSPSTGPFNEAGSTGAAPPFPNPPAPGNLFVEGAPVAASLTARNFEGGYNYVHTITSTQESLNGTVNNVPQQGAPYVTNVTAVTLAGYPVGACSFVQTVGAYNSVK